MHKRGGQLCEFNGVDIISDLMILLICHDWKNFITCLYVEATKYFGLFLYLHSMAYIYSMVLLCPVQLEGVEPQFS